MLFAVVVWNPAYGQARKLSFIRDAEIENTIGALATPLFLAAGLEPSNIRVYLVNDRQLNAFVAGGQKIFINTGLLMRTEHAGQVTGVIAHETGHISGGHLARTQDALSDLSAQGILAFVLGAAAGIATGRADVGQAVTLGGQQIGQRSFLQYSRTQEGAADQAAIKLLDATGNSARGLLEFLEILGDQDLVGARHQDPYVRTHPLTRDRIRTLANHVAVSPFSENVPSPEIAVAHRRMRAKLFAFLEPLAQTLRRYKANDGDPISRYAHAIAYYRQPDLNRALQLIDGLIAERPDDPYYHELKGQMLFENGRVREALAPYRTAARLMSGSPLILIGLARVQIEMNDPAQLEPAIVNFRAALRNDPNNPFVWRQLAIAHGRRGELGESSLALAEEALLLGKPAEAAYHAGRAENVFARGAPGWLKARDIAGAADALRKTQKKEKKKE